ncbi:MAG: hypothetical protein E7626_05885 [Ruminococcaceae bacterium]|nr:hypothetical protein [Oscillospiraceae bacterium]
MNDHKIPNTQNSPNKKGKKGCTIFAIFILVFICLCVVLPLTMGIPETEKTQELPRNVKQLMEACNVAQEDAIIINDILEKCQITEIEKIEHDDLLDNIYSEGDTGYRIQSQGVKNIIMYLNAEKQVIIVRHASIDMYSNGEYKTPFSAFYLTTSQKTALQIYTQNAVSSILKSPSSAEFPNISNWSFGRLVADGTVVVESYVDAQNSFGATVRSNFYLIYKITGNIDDGDFSVIYFELDNEVIVDIRQPQ